MNGPKSSPIRPVTAGGTSNRRVLRAAAMVVSGGVLLQVGGCAASLAPIVLSIAESVAFNAILQALLPP